MNKEQLENLQTSRLDEILRAELRKDKPDGDLVRQILTVLREREQDQSVEITPEVQAAWDKYQKKTNGRTERVKPTARNWVYRSAAALLTVAVVFLALVANPVEAKADTWWEKLMSWTSELFSARNLGETDYYTAEYVFTTDNEGLQEVYNTVTELGVTVPVVPMWLPDGYMLAECELSQLQVKNLVCAHFYSADNLITFQVEIFEQGVLRRYQKDGDNVVLHEIDGVTYHVMRNNGRWVSVWINENVECFLSAECEEEDFLKF